MGAPITRVVDNLAEMHDTLLHQIGRIRLTLDDYERTVKQLQREMNSPKDKWHGEPIAEPNKEEPQNEPS